MGIQEEREGEMVREGLDDGEGREVGGDGGGGVRRTLFSSELNDERDVAEILLLVGVDSSPLAVSRLCSLSIVHIAKL